jgi:hypothetical protein
MGSGERKRPTSGSKLNCRRVKQVLGVGAEVATGLVWSNHLHEVGWLLVMKDFESDDCNFEYYPLFYGQPVELGKQWSNVVKLSGRRKDDLSKGILNKLESLDRGGRETKEQGIAKVKPTGNQRIGKEHSSVVIQKWTNLTKLSYDMIARFGNRGDVIIKRKIRVKNHSEITSR